MDKEIYAAAITPFTADGRPDVDGFVENLHSLKETGIDGALLMGSSGEFPHLTFEERKTLLRAAAENRPEGFRLLVHAGGAAFPDVLDLVRETTRLGLDGALVITPFYFQAQTKEAALTQYYRTLMAEGPVLLYHFPLNTGVILRPEWVGQMAEEGLVGIKDSSSNMPFLQTVLTLTPPSFKAYTGSGSAFLQGLAAGSKGGIMAVAQIQPKELRLLLTAFLSGNLSEAQEIQRRIVPVDRATTGTYGVAGLKWAAGRVGLRTSPPRPPLLPLSPSDEAGLLKILEAAALV